MRITRARLVVGNYDRAFLMNMSDDEWEQHPEFHRRLRWRASYRNTGWYVEARTRRGALMSLAKAEWPS